MLHLMLSMPAASSSEELSLAAWACADLVALHARALAGREEGSVPSTPHFKWGVPSAAMATCATIPSRKRKQGLATSPQSEEKKLPAAEAKASKPPMRLQPAATKSRTELSRGSRMLVGPGAGTGTRA